MKNIEEKVLITTLYNALSVIQNQTIENLKSVRWYIDCGDNDFLYEGNSMVHIF